MSAGVRKKGTIRLGTARLTLIFLASVAAQICLAVVMLALANMQGPRAVFTVAEDGSRAIAHCWGVTILADVDGQITDAGWSRRTEIFVDAGFPMQWLALSGSSTETITLPTTYLPPGPLYRRKNFLLTTVRPVGVDLTPLAVNLIISTSCVCALAYGFMVARSKRRIRRGRCSWCGYNLVGSAGAPCPECGH